MPKKMEVNELQEARSKLAGVEGLLAVNLARQGEIIAARRDRKTAEDDILIRANAFLDGDESAVDVQAEAAELEKLHAEEKLLRAAGQIQAAKVEELTVAASREEYARRKPEVIALIKRMINAVYEYQNTFDEYSKLQAEFPAKGLRGMVPGFAWPGLTSASIENVKNAVRFRLKGMGLEEALKKGGDR